MSGSEIFLILALGAAVYRVTRFAIKDTLIQNQRLWLHNRITTWRPKVEDSPTRDKILELLQCPHCFGGQASWIAVVIAMQWTSIPLPVMAWLATWTVVEVFWHVIEQPVESHVSFKTMLKHRDVGPYVNE